MPATTRNQWKKLASNKNNTPASNNEVIAAAAESVEILPEASTSDQDNMNIENNYDLLDFESSLYNELSSDTIPSCFASQEAGSCHSQEKTSTTLNDDTDALSGSEASSVSWKADETNNDPMKTVNPSDVFGSFGAFSSMDSQNTFAPFGCESSVFMSPMASPLASPESRSRSNSIEVPEIGSPVSSYCSEDEEREDINTPEALIDELFAETVSEVHTTPFVVSSQTSTSSIAVANRELASQERRRSNAESVVAYQKSLAPEVIEHEESSQESDFSEAMDELEQTLSQDSDYSPTPVTKKAFHFKASPPQVKNSGFVIDIPLSLIKQEQEPPKKSNRGRKRKVVDDDYEVERTACKKSKNAAAAARYREKKAKESKGACHDLEDVQRVNKGLRNDADRLLRERNMLITLMYSAFKKYPHIKMPAWMDRFAPSK